MVVNCNLGLLDNSLTNQHMVSQVGDWSTCVSGGALNSTHSLTKTAIF